MSNFNGMQANVGLLPGSSPASAVLTPAQAAAQMSQQASMQLQSAQAQMGVAYGGGAGFSFGQQFQQRPHRVLGLGADQVDGLGSSPAHLQVLVIEQGD